MVDEEEAAELITGSLAPVSVVEWVEGGGYGEVGPRIDGKTIWKIEMNFPEEDLSGAFHDRKPRTLYERLSMTGNPPL